MGRKRRFTGTSAVVCLLLIHGASAQQHSAAWPTLDFRQQPHQPWGGSLRSTFGRGEAHHCSAWWQPPADRGPDSARVDLRFDAAWSGWSGLTATSELRLSAQVPLTAQHTLRIGLGAAHDRHQSGVTPLIQCVFEGPLGPSVFRLQWRTRLASLPAHPMQRATAPFAAITVTRDHDHGWASCWLAWNGHGFRLAATAWHELARGRSAGLPIAVGLRLIGAPWGLQLGGVWGVGQRNATNWAGVDAWGGSEFSAAW